MAAGTQTSRSGFMGPRRSFTTGQDVITRLYVGAELEHPDVIWNTRGNSSEQPRPREAGLNQRRQSVKVQGGLGLLFGFTGRASGHRCHPIALRRPQAALAANPDLPTQRGLRNHAERATLRVLRVYSRVRDHRPLEL